MSTQQNFESWIVSRKQDPAAHLAPSVMEEILTEESSPSFSSPISRYPSWLISTTCLVAGLGKLSLIFHLAF